MEAAIVETRLDTLCQDEAIVINGTRYTADNPQGQEILTSAAGCDSVILNVALTFVAPAPQISVEPPPCPGQNGRLRVDSIGGSPPPFTLSLDGQSFFPIEALPYEVARPAGSYSLNLRDALGCSAQASVTIPEGEPLAIDLGGPYELTLGDSLQLNPSFNFDPQAIAWAPDSLLSCQDCLSPSLSPSQSLTLTLQATASEGCSTDASVAVVVNRNVEIFAPNIFSPNGDGANDRFTLFAADSQVRNIERLEIYDRWGNQVFVGANLRPGNLQEGWDGNFRGQPLDPAVFIYFATVEWADGRTTLLRGEVVLMR